MAGTDVNANNRVERCDLVQLFEIMDGKSRAILWYLWWHRYAGISELRRLTGGPCDFEVLHRLKEVINEKAQRLWGRPIVNFERSKTDPATGKQVTFSWWLLGEDDILFGKRNRPLVDVFDEGDAITVIAEVPASATLTCAEIGYRNGILKVKLKKDGRG